MGAETFNKLLDGNERFRKKNKYFPKLRHEQKPEFVIVACSDSRVSPSVILDMELGGIFEIRLAGNFVDHNAVASVEFALEFTGARKILVLSHSKCGAMIEAHKMLSHTDSEDKSSRETTLTKFTQELRGELLEICGKKSSLLDCIIRNASNQLRKLMASQVVGDLFEKGDLALATGLYDLDSGELRIFPFPNNEGKFD